MGTITGASWVINLKRRVDRRERFLARYARLGPPLPLEIVTAVDGLDARALAAHPLASCASASNEYGDNCNARATILSHLQIWERIAHGAGDYGIVFEDDVLFAEDGRFNALWPSMEASFPAEVLEGPAVLYCGTGARLPGTGAPARAEAGDVARAHVASVISPYVGTPRFDSPFVFRWLGAFAYMLTKRSARSLLDEVSRDAIRTTLDLWLKDRFVSGRYVTIPLLAYHCEYDLRRYDSDIFGFRTPLDTLEAPMATGQERPIATFIVPSVDSGTRWEATVSSIAARARGALRVEVLTAAGSGAAAARVASAARTLGIADVELVAVDCAARDRLHLHDTYNELAQVAIARGASLIAVWSADAPICTDGWDERLLRHYDMLLARDAARPACFQVKVKDALEFAHPILTRGFIETVGHVARSPAVDDYVKLISYLTRTHVFVREMEIDPCEPEPAAAADDAAALDHFEQHPETRLAIDCAIAAVLGSPSYRACGVWINIPPQWAARRVVGQVAGELPRFFRRGTSGSRSTAPRA